MAFNIVDLVKDQISDQLLGQMGSVLGTDGAKTSAALGGTLPGLLSGLTQASSQPGGAGALFNAAQSQDPGLLGNMGNLLGGGDDTSRVIEQGNSTLGSLLGDGAVGKLAGILAEFAGVSRIGSGSLMGMLAPIIIGAIKNHIGSSNLDAGGLANLLGEQRGNVEAAMPQGLMGQMQSQGFFDSIAPATAAPVQQAAAPAAAPQAAATPAPAPVQQPAAPSGGGLMRWLLPVVALAILGLVAWKFLGGNAPTAPEVPTVDPELATSIDVELPEGVEIDKISDGLSGIVTDTASTLEGITDEASARAALPNLKDVNTRLGGISDLVSRLPEPAQAALAPSISSGISTLQPIADKILAMPAVGPVIEPVLRPLLDALQGMAG